MFIVEYVIKSQTSGGNLISTSKGKAETMTVGLANASDVYNFIGSYSAQYPGFKVINVCKYVKGELEKYEVVYKNRLVLVEVTK